IAGVPVDFVIESVTIQIRKIESRGATGTDTSGVVDDGTGKRTSAGGQVNTRMSRVQGGIPGNQVCLVVSVNICKIESGGRECRGAWQVIVCKGKSPVAV